MTISEANHQLALVTSSNPTTSYEELLESQKELFSKQICELQNIVLRQCKLTGVNPLSQEMAAGALSIKIGKRPRDLLNPKAIKYMQSIFSVKDEISKKEIRAISALFGLAATQVRAFFTGQRSRVRRFIRLSREKAIKSAECIQEQDGSLSFNADIPNHPVPLSSVGPSSIEAPSCSMQNEVLADTNDSDKYFIANIFNMLRKEGTFSGQVKLMEWILQIQNASVLYWFLTNGGVMILATWLSEAAIEEQTSVLHAILRVLCHLPLHKALPAHMSAILQSVNKLQFYRGPDISNRAKSLLSRWSKMFARSQAIRKANANISPVDAQNEMLLKQSIGEIMENESLESRIDNPPGTYLLQENSENSRNLGSSQSIKLLTAPSDDSNIKLLRGLSSHTRERRKVQLVEQPGQKAAGRGPQVTRLVPTTQGRPLSADDIQKAKMRAQFMRTKYGESYISPQKKTEVPRASSTSKTHVRMKAEEHGTAPSSSMTPLAADTHVQPKIEEHKKPVLSNDVQEADSKFGDKKPISGNDAQEVHGKVNMDADEPVWKKCKRFQISWVTPPEMKINKEWSVCSGENSKEVEVQNNRIKREKEVFYNTVLEIPPNPKEPWDQEMDYDDSLTPEVPTEQLPDDDDDNNMVTEASSMNFNSGVSSNYTASTSTVYEHNRSMPEPDLELLAVLLKNPEIVFALTAGQGGNLTNEQMVRLLDAIKANSARGGSIASLVSGLVERKPEEKVEVSLPSPTPSSNPVTSAWRPESVKNPFTRQSVSVNGDAYAIPGVYFQETLNQQAVAPITHQRFPEQRNIPDDWRNHPAPISGLPVTQAISQRFPDQRNIHGQSLQAYYKPQRQIISQSWTGRPNPVENNNAYGSRDMQAGPSWVRNGDEPGFESWSPENSPVRSHDGWNYSEPHGQSYNYRPRMHNDPSRFRDYGGRNEVSRWRDRRR